MIKKKTWLIKKHLTGSLESNKKNLVKKYLLYKTLWTKYVDQVKKSQNTILPCTVDLSNDLIQKYQNPDQNFQTNEILALGQKTTGADITIFGNKTFLR